jgi:uncharacterized protein (DUF433 family)
MVDIYRAPLLTVPDAAEYLAVPQSTISGWKRDAVIHSVDPRGKNWPTLPFVGVVETFVLDRLVKMGIRKQAIRDTAHTIRQRLGDEYGLARPGLGVHGRDILLKIGEEHYRGTDLQQAVSDAITDFRALVVWDSDDNPTRLHLSNFGDNVILDPRFGWGAPVIEQTKVPVMSIIDQYLSGDSMAGLAYDFDMERDDVEELVRGYLAASRRAAA